MCILSQHEHVGLAGPEATGGVHAFGGPELLKLIACPGNAFQAACVPSGTETRAKLSAELRTRGCWMLSCVGNSGCSRLGQQVPRTEPVSVSIPAPCFQLSTGNSCCLFLFRATARRDAVFRAWLQKAQLTDELGED